MAQRHQQDQDLPALLGSELVQSAAEDFASAGFMVDRLLIHRFIASLLTKRFVILTGLSGSGKSKLAHALALWLSPETEEPTAITNADPSNAQDASWLTVGSELPSNRVYYRVDAVDQLAVQFSNERQDGQRIKVTLPKGLIEEWVGIIQEHGFTRETLPRTIREAVAQITQYSTQLNSFETHLKAAAFAMIEQSTEVPTSQGSQTIVDDGISPDKNRASHEEQFERPPYVVVAVGADWNSNESVLGYPDALHPDQYVRTPILDLIIRAESQPQSPHFLILDEMNLSHVERYFADVLSAIESGEPIHLYSNSQSSDSKLRDGVPRSIHLPDNLFIVGTVNVDETTYLFSPKVLDRANTIEFRVAESDLRAFLANPSGIRIDTLRGKGARYATALLAAARNENVTCQPGVQSRVNDELTMFFHVMAHHGYEFGFRSALEISRFVGLFLDIGDGRVDFYTAMDAQIYQKIIPRLNGSRSRLEPVLRSLITLCRMERQWEPTSSGEVILMNRPSILNAAISSGASSDFEPVPSPISSMDPQSTTFPLSEAKLQRMSQVVRQNGFVSFAEA